MAARLLTAVLVLAMLAAAVWRLDHPPRSPREEIWLRGSKRLLDNGLYRDSYERARKVLSINANNVEARKLLDVLEIYGHLANKDPSAATLKRFERVRGEQPDSPYVYMIGAELHARMGDMEEAFDLHQQAADLRQDLPHNWFGLGRAFRATGQSAEALDAFEHAAEGGRRALYSLELAREYFRVQRFDVAAAAYRQAWIHNPRRLEARIGEVRCMLYTGRYAEALEYIDRVNALIESDRRKMRRRARIEGVARAGSYDRVNGLPLKTWRKYIHQLQLWALARQAGSPPPAPDPELAASALGEVLDEDLAYLR